MCCERIAPALWVVGVLAHSVGPERAIDGGAAAHFGIVVIGARQADVAANILDLANILQPGQVTAVCFCEGADEVTGAAWRVAGCRQHLDREGHGVAASTPLAGPIAKVREPILVLAGPGYVRISPQGDRFCPWRQSTWSNPFSRPGNAVTGVSTEVGFKVPCIGAHFLKRNSFP